MRGYLIQTLILVLALCVAGPGWSQSTTVSQEANLMDGPGSVGVVLDILNPGMTVEVLTVEGNWARIRIPATSEVGWVDTGALTRDETMMEMKRRSEMSATELNRVKGRVQVISGSLGGIEQRVDSLLYMLTGGESQEPSTRETVAMEDASSQMERRAMAMQYGGFALAGGGPYRWSNQFVMGAYLRGGQSFYGITMRRSFDSRGRNMLTCRAQYGLGELRGKADDFVDWTVGMDFNFFPETYFIYPYFGAHFGMRHQLELTPEGRNFLIATPAIGIQAELGSIFTLGAELRGLFRFENGERRDDGMVSFSAGYRW